VNLNLNATFNLDMIGRRAADPLSDPPGHARITSRSSPTDANDHVKVNGRVQVDVHVE
jgi:hypothetical protein